MPISESRRLCRNSVGHLANAGFFDCKARLAVQAKDYDAKASFAEVARQWRELARQAEQLERDRGVPYS